jgi:hypothetical protein
MKRNGSYSPGHRNCPTSLDLDKKKEWSGWIEQKRGEEPLRVFQFFRCVFDFNLSKRFASTKSYQNAGNTC